MHNRLSVFFIALLLTGSLRGLPTDPLETSSFLAPEEAFQLQVSLQSPDTVVLHWNIAPHCYLYADRLKIRLQHPEKKGSLFHFTALPPPDTKEDRDLGMQAIYPQSLSFPLTLPAHTLTQLPHHLVIDYQGCTQSGFCYPPSTFSFTLKGQNARLTQVIPTTGADASLPPPKAATRTPGDLFFEGKARPYLILSFYVFGLFLSVTPCVLPMIPILFGIISGRARLHTLQAFGLSLTYVLALSVTYAAGGLVAVLFGKNIQALLQKPLPLFLFAGLFFYLGCVQLGVGQLRLPLFLQNTLQRWQHKQKGGSYVGAASMGILATLMASPCVSAPLIGVLSYLSQTGDLWLGGACLFAMGLGMGTLLIVMGTLGGKYLPKKGPWMVTLNKAIALMLFGLSITFLARILPPPLTLTLWGVWLVCGAWCMGTFRTQANWVGRLGILPLLYATLLFWGAWQGETQPLKPLHNPWQTIATSTFPASAFTTVHSSTQLNMLQETARKEGKPLLVLVRANWCDNCHLLEKKLLQDPNIQSKLTDWQGVRLDITQYTPSQQALLHQWGVMGPPAILFFNKEGQEITSERLYGAISKAQFLLTLQQLQAVLHPVAPTITSYSERTR